MYYMTPSLTLVSQVTQLDNLSPLYWDLCVCIDHQVGSGNPAEPSVDCFRLCCGQNWPILPNFFCKMYLLYM